MDISREIIATREDSQAAVKETAVDPLSLRMTDDSLGTQRAEIDERVKATEYQKDREATEQKAASLAGQGTAMAIDIDSTQDAKIKENIVWKADFETGNISQWNGKGDFLNQGSGMYNLITFAHTGNFAADLTIDTDAPSESGAHAAYLFYWQQLPEDGYYYSVWYYFPNQVHIREWWTIMQWKSTYDGNTDNSVRVFSVGVQEVADGLKLTLNQRPNPSESDNNNVVFNQNITLIPINQWFHVEAYYKRATDDTGQVILWQDDKELFNLSGVTTAFSDNTVYWSVHNYSSGLDPSPTSIYVDDFAISKVQVGDRLLP